MLDAVFEQEGDVLYVWHADRTRHEDMSGAGDAVGYAQMPAFFAGRFVAREFWNVLTRTRAKRGFGRSGAFFFFSANARERDATTTDLPV